MTVPTLDKTDYAASKEFYRDVTVLLRACVGADEYFKQSNPDLDTTMKKLEKAIKLFNKKYSDLSAALKNTKGELHLQLSFKEDTLQTCFAHSASRVQGVKSVGLRAFNEIEVSNTAGVAALAENITKTLYLTFMNQVGEETSVLLKKVGKKIEFIADYTEIQNEPSAEFQLVRYYALRQPLNQKVKFSEEIAKIGFHRHITDEYAEIRYDFDPFSRE